MPIGKKDKDKTTEENQKTNREPFSVPRPATRNEAKRTGNMKTLEELQDIRNEIDGKKISLRSILYSVHQVNR